MSNYYIKNNSDYNNIYIPKNINQKKYDNNFLSENNINFILSTNKHKTKNKENIMNNIKSDSTSKVISFNYSQSKPYYKYSHIYTIPNDAKFNLTHAIGNIENDIKITNKKNNEINIKSFVDSKNNYYIKKNINDFCFSCKRNYENKKTENMLKEMFKGQKVETFTKTINIRTFNSPNKPNKNKNIIINFSDIKKDNDDNNKINKSHEMMRNTENIKKDIYNKKNIEILENKTDINNEEEKELRDIENKEQNSIEEDVIKNIENIEVNYSEEKEINEVENKEEQNGNKKKENELNSIEKKDGKNSEQNKDIDILDANKNYLKEENKNLSENNMNDVENSSSKNGEYYNSKELNEIKEDTEKDEKKEDNILNENILNSDNNDKSEEKLENKINENNNINNIKIIKDDSIKKENDNTNDISTNINDIKNTSKKISNLIENLESMKIEKCKEKNETNNYQIKKDNVFNNDVIHNTGLNQREENNNFINNKENNNYIQHNKEEEKEDNKINSNKKTDIKENMECLNLEDEKVINNIITSNEQNEKNIKNDKKELIYLDNLDNKENKKTLDNIKKEDNVELKKEENNIIKNKDIIQIEENEEFKEIKNKDDELKNDNYLKEEKEIDYINTFNKDLVIESKSENDITNNINNEQEEINTKNEKIKNKLEIKIENQIEIKNQINSISKSQKLIDSWSQTPSEEIPPIFPLNNNKTIKKISLFPDNNNIKKDSKNEENNTSNNQRNDSINIMLDLSKERVDTRFSKRSKDSHYTQNKEEKGIFKEDYILKDLEIISEDEIKRLNLNQIALRFIEVLYKDIEKIKKKEELKIYDEKIILLANIIIYMKNLNQLKVLECLKKAADTYNKIEVFEKLDKKVEELNKFKKFGFSDTSIINKNNSILSNEKGYTGRMSDSKYNK